MFGLSLSQREMIVLDLLYENTSINNISILLKLKIDCDYKKINDVLNEMVRIFDTFRIRLKNNNGIPEQYIVDHEYQNYPFEEVENDEECQNKAEQYAEIPLFKYDGQLYSFNIFYNKENGKYRLLYSTNHNISDGMAMAIFSVYFQQLITDQPIDEKLIDSFKKTYDDEVKYLASAGFTRDQEYWNSKIASYKGSAFLDDDYNVEGDEGRAQTFQIGDELNTKIVNFCNENSVTTDDFYNSIIALYKSILTNNSSVSIGLLLHNRRSKKQRAMLGTFARVVPLIIDIDMEMSFSDYLTMFKKEKYTLMKHCRYDVITLNNLFEKSYTDLNTSMQMFKVTDNFYETFDVEWLHRKSHSNSICAKFSNYNYDLIPDVSYEYNSFQISDVEIKMMSDRVFNMMNYFVENHDEKLSDVNIFNEDISVINNQFNNTASEYPCNATIVELFEKQVKTTPDSVAVEFENEKITFFELNQKANIIAHKLRGLGVGADDLVAIIADRSIEMVCGIYGIVKSGAAYLPIDTAYPENRIKYMISDSKPKAIFKYTEKADISDQEIPVFDLSELDSWESVEENPKIITKPENLLYCIYTSGTSGVPKGVMIENRSVVNHLYLMRKAFYHNSFAPTPLFTSIAFDFTVPALWGAILFGEKLVVFREPADLINYTEHNKLALLKITPSLFNSLYDGFNNHKGMIESIVFGGEVFAKDLLEKVHNVFGTDISVFNEYGPTEATVFTTYDKIEDNKMITIGKPVANSRIYILNDNKYCGIGVAGEICICGDGVARGYLNNAELTSEKFFEAPIYKYRMYRSGDLGSWLPDGRIKYLGRIDEQFKIRGYRVELSEIENNIRNIEYVNDCAVIVKTDSCGDKAIHAYYTSDREHNAIKLKEKLTDVLPDYMIPAYIMRLDKIPVTVNGKIDRDALPEIDSMASSEYVAPRNENEELLCKTLEELLNVEKVGIYDSFFELGGDSIKAIRIISKLRNLGYEASVNDILNGKTVEKLARTLRKKNSACEYEQGDVNGVVEPTPIIREFIENKPAVPGHYNQAIMFDVTGIENSIIKRSVRKIVIHHDILRAVLKNDMIEIRPSSDSRLFDFCEFDRRDLPDAEKSIIDKCTEIQGSIDLENGPIVKIAVFDLGVQKKMMFCIHHLAVDGISWQIIGEDFETVSAMLKSGEEPVLPKKTMSFIEWSRKLKEYGENTSSDTREYWKNENRKIENGRIRGDFSGEKAGAFSDEIDADNTEKIINKSSNLYGATSEEVLIAALMKAVNSITGQKELAVKIESHGREELFKKMDISRTVGWFTNKYPVNFSMSDDNEKLIINVKDTLRCVPNSGIDYGFIEKSESPDICFNYLGNLNGISTDSYSLFSCGKQISDDNKLPDNITVLSHISDGKLTFAFISRSEAYGEEFIEKLASAYKKYVIELADYCEGSVSDSATKSDLTDRTVDDSDLSFINSLLD